MKRLLWLSVVLICTAHSVYAQQGLQAYVVTGTGAQARIALTGSAIVLHQLTWNVTGTVSSCTVALDTSADGVSWSAGNAIAGQTCTSNGQSSLSASAPFNFVRVNVTTFSGTGSVVVTWSGYVASPNGVVPSGTTVSGSDITFPGNVQAAITDKGGQVYNVKAYGVLGDERFTTDAVTTASSTTLTSATAAFTSADTGKTITVNAGPNAILTATYTSGATVTGTVNQYCTVGTFNGGGSSAAGFLLLTGTNTIAASTALDITNVGTGFTSAPTSAVLTDGTATCSGTIVIATTLIALPVVTTATYVNATTVTLGVAATNTTSSSRMAIGTDDSAAIIALLTTVYNAGGGTIYFPRQSGTAYLILSQLVIPNDGVSPTSTQTPLTIYGAGGDYRAFTFSNANAQGSYKGTVLDMRYTSSTGGKIDTFGQGQVEISNLVMMDYGDDTTPYINTDNNSLAGSTSNLYIHDVVFTDNPRKLSAYRTPNKTAIYLGLSLSSRIVHNWFDRIQVGVYLTDYSNTNEIAYNYWTDASGGDFNTGAIIINKNAAGSIPGNAIRGPVTDNVITGNNIEMTNYQHGVLLSIASKNYIIFNQFVDQLTNPTVLDLIDVVPASTFNMIIDQSVIPTNGVAVTIGDDSTFSIHPCVTISTANGCMNQLIVTPPAGGQVVATSNNSVGALNFNNTAGTVNYQILNAGANWFYGTTNIDTVFFRNTAEKLRLTTAGVSTPGSFASTVATGTAPLAITSTTPVANLSLGGGAGTTVKSAIYTTDTNCANGASPAVCASAAAGAVAVPTGTNPTLTINTTAVTANSRIFLQIDESLIIPATTCNTTLSTLVQPVITARVAATSFTIQIGAVIATNPVCVSYHIEN